MKFTTQKYLTTSLPDDEKLPEGVAFADLETGFTSNDEEALNEYLRQVLEDDKPLELLNQPRGEVDEAER